MSFYFNVVSERKVTYKSLANKIDFPSLEYSNDFLDSEEEIIGTKIFIPQKSTRGITISKDEQGYSIGINVIASEEDFNLAIQTTKCISELTEGSIIAEDSEEHIARSELSAKYNQAWIDGIKTLGANVLIERIGKEKEILSVGCCYMTYAVGPNVNSQLKYSNEEEYYHALVKHIQKTQFFDRNKYVIPNLLFVSNKETKAQKRILVFYPTGSEFLSQADFVVFPVGNGSYEIPYEMLKDIATDKFKLIDETQYVVEPLTEEEYAQIIQSIETELGKVSEADLKNRYSELTDHELNDEFNRITSIPDARIKIFALVRMTALMSEYESRGLDLPNASGKAVEDKQEPTPPKLTRKVETRKIESQKPWWKFW